MSIKKTWFSYILWLVATGFSILFTYYSVSKLTAYWGVYGYQSVGYLAGYTTGILVLGVLLCLLFRKLRNSIRLPLMKKWTARGLHILAFLLITALFLGMQYLCGYLFGNSVFLQVEQSVSIFEMAKIGDSLYDTEILESAFSSMSLVPSVFESIYLKVLSVLFMFLGNYVEVMVYFQMTLRILSFVFLIVIGWSIQKGIYAWIPAFLYAVSPVFVSMIGNVGPANFWLCICLAGIAFICLLEKAWKQKLITYIAMALWGILICAFIFAAKYNVLFQNGAVFFSGADLKVLHSILCIDMSVLAVLMIFSCTSFWFSKTDHASLYVIPMLTAAGLLLPLYHMEADVVFFLILFIMLWSYFLVAEGMHVLFSAKPKVLTGQKPEVASDHMIEETASKEEPAIEDYDWTEMQTLMEQKSEEELPEKQEEDSSMEDTGVIRVSDILKAINEEESTDAVSEEEEIPDKTAMIENVLPMPKKHVNRSFEYSFEPSEDMMHYDVEVEGDDYDYE